MTSRYTVPAPVFSEDSPALDQAAVIGKAATERGAMRILQQHFAGTGVVPSGVKKAVPELRGRGPIDGWIPVFTD